MGECQWINGGMWILLVMVLSFWLVEAQDDYSGPIKCYYCFGEAANSSCSDPVSPRKGIGKSLEVIECEHGICLKWTHYWNSKLYMHRTCSARMTHFKIMMIDGVCRSERTGNGYLCMCGKHLCNGTGKYKTSAYNFVVVLSAFFLLTQTTLGWNS